MSEREHERAVLLALRTNEELRRLFDQVGTKQAPRGRVLTAYRQARRALTGRADDLGAVREVVAELRRSVADVAYRTLAVAARMGSMQALRTLQVYDLPTANVDELTPIAEPLEAWMTTVDAQMAAVVALAITGNEEAILGDESRVGILSPAPIVREGTRWLAFTTLAALTARLERNTPSGDAYVRQAVAAIDERTTDCCLRVHGTTAPMAGKFQLAGTPRYADQMSAPPFHWYCRTSVALVRAADANDGLTQRMREAGAAELDARATTGRRVEIDPADATSRRSAAAGGETTQRARTGPQTPQGPRTGPQGQAQPPRTAQPRVSAEQRAAAEYQQAWVNGSSQRRSVALKEGIRQEFNLPGLVMNRRGFALTDAEVARARRGVRTMYEQTQADFARRGVETVTLYRGVKSDIRVPGTVESWTTDARTARKFNGHDIIEAEIPVGRIWSFSGGPLWKNGRYGEQYEYMVMAEEPR